MLRFDERVPVAFGNDPTKPVIARMIFVRRPDITFYWAGPPLGGSNQLCLFRPGPPPAPDADFFWNVDVRTTGLDSVESWTLGRNDLRMIRGHMESSTLAAVEESPDKSIIKTEWTLKFATGKYGQRWRLWLDARLRYAPIRSELTHWQAKEDGAIEDLPGERPTVTEVGWAETNGVVVPVSIKGTQENRKAFDFVLNWKQVNSELASETFEKTGLGLPGRTLVIDGREKKRVTLGRLDGTPLNPGNSPVDWGHSSRVFWAITNVALIAAIAAIVWRRRRITKARRETAIAHPSKRT